MVVLQLMTCHRWAPRLVLVATLLTGLLTIVFSYEVADSNGHLPPDEPHPAISTMGDENPEHVVFALGFSVLAVELVFMLVYVWHVMASSLPRGVNATQLFLGLIVIPPLCIMAWVPDSVSSAHFAAAATMFALLGLYQIFFAVVVSLASLSVLGVPITATSEERSLSCSPITTICLLWFFCCSIIALSCAASWVTEDEDRNNQLEYAAAAFEFLYFLGLWPMIGPDSVERLKYQLLPL